MKAESAIFVEQATIILARAQIMLRAGLNEDAARAAYMAGFHVAQAYIFERTDKTSKSHKGVQIEFFRLTKDDPRIDVELRKFLSQSYDYKSVADYFTGPDASTSAEEATNALATSRRFVTHVSELVTIPPPPPDGLHSLP